MLNQVWNLQRSQSFSAPYRHFRVIGYFKCHNKDKFMNHHKQVIYYTGHGQHSIVVNITGARLETIKLLSSKCKHMYPVIQYRTVFNMSVRDDIHSYTHRLAGAVHRSSLHCNSRGNNYPQRLAEYFSGSGNIQQALSLFKLLESI